MSLTTEIKALLKKGDTATTNAEKHYKAAGARLIKLRKGKTKKEFEKVVSKTCGIKQSWAYRLMKLARGEITLAGERAGTTKRMRKSRKRTQRDVQKPELAAEDLQGDTPQQQWIYSLSNMAGEAVSLQAFWDKTFGKEWKEFEVASDMVTLVQQAVEAWTQIAEELTTRAGAIPIRRTSHGS